MTNETKDAPEMKLPTTAQEIHETLQDGQMARICLEGGSEEWIKVRKISRKEFPQLADAIMRNASEQTAEVALYLGKEDAFAERLTDECFFAVLKEGRRLNFSRFNTWFECVQDTLKLTKVEAPQLAMVTEALVAAMQKQKT